MTKDLYLQFESEEQAKEYLYNMTTKEYLYNMTKDLYLQFESEEQAKEYLYTQAPIAFDEETQEPTEFQSQPNYQNIDIIGAIFEETGETLTDSEGIELPVLEQVPGYHVNVRVVGSEVSDDLEPFAVQPKTPLRVWG
jgi:DNA-dependent RNA polymerase auxiliary subunit epsilon